jgi:hypothetical protein
MDDAAYDVLSSQQPANMSLIRLRDLESWDLELATTRSGRSLVEYYFTCTPSLPLFVLEHQTDVDVITYVDADFFFFSDPEPIFKALTGQSILMVGHRFPPKLRKLEIYGKFNVGLLSWRRDDSGLACLRWWRERCVEWCYDRLEGSRYADQKYLDEWPKRFDGVQVLQHKGVNAAPWNIGGSKVSMHEGVCIDEQPLICYHVHGLKHVAPFLCDLDLARYGVRPSRALLKYVYAPYLRSLQAVSERLRGVEPDEVRVAQRGAHLRVPDPGPRPQDLRQWVRSSRWAAPVRFLRSVAQRRYVFVVGGHVF